MDAIIYTSNTGSTKRYAEMLGERLLKPVFSSEKAPAELEGKQIIYMGWVMASSIQGLADAVKKYDVKAVCAVGILSMGDDEKSREELISKNPVTGSLYCLPGCFNIKNLSGIYKMMMSMMVKKVESEMKKKENISESERKALKAFTEGIDLVDGTKLDEIAAEFAE
ncbi:MAG: hypothetical protein MJ177_01740 [Clostridia bacterium]|nr:hypothetical protein [Clostridia bacterium]